MRYPTGGRGRLCAWQIESVKTDTPDVRFGSIAAASRPSAIGHVRPINQ